jgi:chromosome segregation ATPase
MKNAMNQSNPFNGPRVTIIILSFLFVAAAGTAVWVMGEKKKEANHSTTLNLQVEELNGLKTELEGKLASLQLDIEDQISANDTLSAELENKIAEVKNLTHQISKAKKQLAMSKENAKAIKVRMAKLEELKFALEVDILALKEENSTLYITNESLLSALEDHEQDITLLNAKNATITQENQKLQQRLFTLAPAGIKADNFIISAQQRNNKITTRAKRADEIKVTFNIDNVPSDLQGKRDIYLVLTEFNGNHLENIETQTVKVQTRDTPIKVSAADIEHLNLTDRQQVTMSFRPEDDLDPGTYNVLVYADNGFLGSTGLKLR